MLKASLACNPRIRVLRQYSVVICPIGELLRYAREN